MREPLTAMPKLTVTNLPDGMHIEALGHAQMDMLLNLQEKVAKSVSKELFECDDAAFYSDLFDGQGRVLGLLDGKTLLACSVISWPGSDSANNLGVEIGLGSEQLSTVANLEAAYVLPGFQGRGIAEILSGKQLDFARQMEKRHILSTASPANLYSLKNLFSLSFRIKKVTEKYGGKIRCIMYRDLSVMGHKETIGDEYKKALVFYDDLKTQKNLLEQGWEGTGVKTTKTKNIFDIVFSYNQ
jgi:GNAT superfamily N-acetyltransferase